MGRLGLTVGLMIYVETGPWLVVVVALARDATARTVGLIAGLRLLGSSMVLASWLRRSLWSPLLKPFAALGFGALLLRAGLTAWRRGWVEWRGTRDRMDALREGQRVRFP